MNRRVPFRSELKLLFREMRIKQYSPNTIRSCVHYNEDLLSKTGKRVDEITGNDVRDYLQYLIEKKQISSSTVSIAVNALKFFY